MMNAKLTTTSVKSKRNRIIPKTTTCAFCKREFQYKTYHTPKYCSAYCKCWRSRNWENIKGACTKCNKEIIYSGYKAPKFCLECRHPVKMETTCCICGRAYYKKNTITCSATCGNLLKHKTLYPSFVNDIQHMVRLHDEGKKYDEIAAAIGIPVGTVRSRLHRYHVQGRWRVAA